MDKAPADTPSKKRLRNEIGPGRYHGFLWCVVMPNMDRILILSVYKEQV